MEEKRWRVSRLMLSACFMSSLITSFLLRVGKPVVESLRAAEPSLIVYPSLLLDSDYIVQISTNSLQMQCLGRSQAFIKHILYTKFFHVHQRPPSRVEGPQIGHFSGFSCQFCVTLGTTHSLQSSRFPQLCNEKVIIDRWQRILFNKYYMWKTQQIKHKRRKLEPRWRSRRTCTHSLLRELQNHNWLLDNH